MKKEKKIKTTLYVDPELWCKLSIRAIIKHVTKTDLVNRAIELLLRKKP